MARRKRPKAAPTFGGYKSEAARWITLVESQFYPDYLEAAVVKYGAPLERFTLLVAEAADSAALLRRISDEPQPLRGQLLRIFRKYVSPDTSVEMLKRKQKIEEVVRDFGDRFRTLDEVQTNLAARPDLDEVMAALLHEYSARGQKGYELTEAFFLWFQEKFAETYDIQGPIGAGHDVMLDEVLDAFPARIPADFLISTKEAGPVAVGFARYDSDRGGAQEDDRTGGNREKANTILNYAHQQGIRLRVIFLNDGPGLLLGSMWDDYAALEMLGEDIIVCTLKMLDERLLDWLAP